MTKAALIAGGGIAGTGAALALHRAGWQPRIVEAHPAGADERGAFLTVAVNGLAALRVLGLDPARVLAAGYPTPTLTMCNGAGRTLAVLPLGGPTADGTTTTTIRRADLYRALRSEAATRAIPIEYGRALHDLDEWPDGVTVTFADGSTARCDLLVGADGLHSRTREVLNPGGPAPTYRGLLNAGGFTAGPVAAAAGAAPGMVCMAFGRRAFFGWSVASDGTVWWFANAPRRRPVAPDGFSPESWRAHLLDLFAGDALPATEIIRATPAVLGPWNTEDLPRVPTWRTARTVLLGDAAHAMSPSSGQGASMAMEDAATLGRCLAEEPDLATALGAYERRRRTRVQKVVAQGRRNSTGKTAGPIGAAVRDVMFPLVVKLLYGKRNPPAWILDHRV